MFKKIRPLRKEVYSSFSLKKNVFMALLMTCVRPGVHASKHKNWVAEMLLKIYRD